jgi:hypothetical protein
MRLSEQLAAAREELRRAEQANRARAEMQSQVGVWYVLCKELYCAASALVP